MRLKIRFDIAIDSLTIRNLRGTIAHWIRLHLQSSGPWVESQALFNVLSIYRKFTIFIILLRKGQKKQKEATFGTHLINLRGVRLVLFGLLKVANCLKRTSLSSFELTKILWMRQ